MCPSSPELRPRSGLALQVGGSDGISPRTHRWIETPAAARYARQTICASWSQAQLHAFGTSACFGPAAMGLSGKARRRKQRGRRGGGRSDHSTPSARPRSQDRRSVAVTPLTPQQVDAKTPEELMADEQAAYNAWYSSNLASPGYRPNLAMQKHQIQVATQEHQQMQESQQELSSVMGSVTGSENYDNRLSSDLVEVSKARVQQWNEESSRREKEHLDQLGWPTQPGTAEYKAQELKLFSDMQRRKVRGCYCCSARFDCTG